MKSAIRQTEFMACACVYAFFAGFSPIGTPSLCLELFGMDNMVIMMGLLQVILYRFSAYTGNTEQCRFGIIHNIFLCSQTARGLGAILGPAAVGKIFDLTGSYNISNTAGSIGITCSVVCMIVIIKLHIRDLSKSKMYC